jgi:hypothetical protein
MFRAAAGGGVRPIAKEINMGSERLARDGVKMISGYFTSL